MTNLMSSTHKTRERRTDWISLANTIVDSYPHGLAHGLQKDAVQNGWDACPTKTRTYVEKNWRMRFELKTVGQRKLLIIEDFGTIGLTGKKIADQFKDDETIPDDERWAKWESFGIGKASIDTLGERGQGKMLFVASSSDYTLYYDSLRADGTYRAGWTQATHSASKLEHWDEDDGRGVIRERLGLEPKNSKGSRFIIVNPKEEVVKAITQGTLVRDIADTWWPIIEKQGAHIGVFTRHKSITVTTPSKFPIDPSRENVSWFKEHVDVRYYSERLKIKRIAFAYSDEELEDRLIGVGVFRAGMRVPTMTFTHRQFASNVYGYVELGDEIDRMIKEQKLERPNHYEFKDSGIWKKVKSVIEQEMDAFATEKLVSGLSAAQKEQSRRTSSQNRALAILKNLTKGWPLGSTGKGPVGPGPGPGPELKQVGIRLSNFIFPNDPNIPRLDYGETIEDFYCTAYNRTDESFELSYRVAIFSGNRQVALVDEGLLSLRAKSSVNIPERYTLKASADLFPEAGQYRLKVSLTDAAKDTKNTLDEVTRNFWVETEPKLSGPFDIQGIKFSEVPHLGVPQEAEWCLQALGSDHYKLYHNIEHPSFLKVEGDDDGQSRYLSEIFAAAALDLLLRKIKSGDVDIKEQRDKLPFNPDNIVDVDPVVFYREIATTWSSIRSNIDS